MLQNKPFQYLGPAVIACALVFPVLGTDGRIRPYPANPVYWEYLGRPVVLIGGSVDDNLFQIDGLEAHLDVLQAAGGNYVRCTLSSRDEGNVWPFLQDPASGKYDLRRFNPDYWDRLTALLEGARRRDIIVQIEIWDSFDYYDGRDMSAPVWQSNPFNPKNNLNYSGEESGLPDAAPCHPTGTCNPFFRTVPALEDNLIVLQFQQAFVDELLRRSLLLGNVLYCMNNETKVSPEWGRFWAGYIRAQAGPERPVQVTDMFDPWDLSDPLHRETLDNPDLYSYLEVSQNNHQQGRPHWDNAQAYRRQVLASGRPRPLNNVKIYGADTGRFGTDQDGIRRFWRNIIGGMASARFHRPPAGLGLGAKAIAQIRSMRMFLNAFDMTRSLPAPQLIKVLEGGEAYATATDSKLAVYFPAGGQVEVQLTGPRDYRLRWLEIDGSLWLPDSATVSSGIVRISAPAAGAFLALLESSGSESGSGESE